MKILTTMMALAGLTEHGIEHVEEYRARAR